MSQSALEKSVANAQQRNFKMCPLFSLKTWAR